MQVGSLTNPGSLTKAAIFLSLLVPPAAFPKLEIIPHLHPAQKAVPAQALRALRLAEILLLMLPQGGIQPAFFTLRQPWVVPEAAEEQLTQTQAQRRHFYLRR